MFPLKPEGRLGGTQVQENAKNVKKGGRKKETRINDLLLPDERRFRKKDILS